MTDETPTNFFEYLREHLGDETESQTNRNQNRYGYRGQRRSNETSVKLEDYTQDQVREFGRMRDAIVLKVQLSRESSSDFKDEILGHLHAYMREKNWTWKHNLQQNEDTAFECAGIVINRLLDGNYFTIHRRPDDDRHHYRRESNYNIRYIIFPHEQADQYTNLGRYRNRVFQWSKKGLIQYLTKVIQQIANEIGGEDRYGRSRSIDINVDGLRNDIVEAEKTVLMARLKFDVYSKINIAEHPKYALAQFLNISSSDLLQIFAPKAHRNVKIQQRAIEKYYKEDDPTLSKDEE